MQHKRTIFILVAAGAILIMGSGLWLATAAPASGQCGSQASSCKNCHEVQGQDPVNSDGSGWHKSHAFGDFCYICHAGNNQAADQVEAHTGMVAPLADVKASCQQCHPNDLQERAQVYASALGVDIGSGDSPAAPADTTAPAAGGETTPPVEAQPQASVPAAPELAVDDPNLVDYSRRYDEIVLGKRPVNWGNVILMAMAALLLIGGGGFVVMNEKLVNVTFGDTKKVETEYPADVVDMLPSLASLKPQVRKSLKNILGNPGKTEKVLSLIEAVVSEEKTEE